MIEQARLRAAEHYPESLTDSMGRVHRCIPREALLRGDWDDSAAIQALMAELEKVPDIAAAPSISPEPPR